MSRRQVRLVILCEDKQQEVFLRRLLSRLGQRVLRVRVAPKGSGAGEQFVRQNYPLEVSAFRSKAKSQQDLGLAAMVDADRFAVRDRLQALDETLHQNSLPERGPDERIALLIPKRNIETWIHYLLGQPVDESTEYPKLHGRERDCQPAVDKLWELYRRSPLPADCPPSLQLGCEELKRLP